MANGTVKILHQVVGATEAAVNDAAAEFQLLSIAFNLIDGQLWGTALMVNKRELMPSPAGISLAGNGRPPFGR